MGRGGLKSQLKDHQSLISTIEKSKSKPETKKADEPENIVLDSVKEKKTKKEKKAKSTDDNDYQSTTLSKKEQRKLKKLEAKKEEEEEEEEVVDEDEVGEDDEEDEELDLEKLAASDSESDINEDDDDEDEDDEEDDDQEDDDEEDDEEDDEDEDEDEEQEDVPLSDVEFDSDADIVPHTKLTINNKAALKEALSRIELPWTKHSFIEHQLVVSAESVEGQIKDIYDDTQRELAFYKQGLDAVSQGKATLLKLKVPFLRPMDYFAEMVKSDEHMDKLKAKLLQEAANKKASEDAKKQRLLKKFGKQVQVATMQERAKQKRDTLEKIKSIKKKRGANELDNDDEFQIALEEATREERPSKRSKPNGKRLAKQAKFGFGGKKSGKRKNDAESSADISGFSASKMKGKKPRLGKSKRSSRRN